ncbi:MAG: DUF4238 domain-containing protein [Bacteroidota bacterium]
MTEKRNQHYIPKFYLRKFSYRANEKQIGLFNVKTGFFFPTATLKHQGSKDFFYGADGVIEEGLSIIEGKLAESLKKIIIERKVPTKLSKEHINLLVFVGLTHLRNPVIIQNMKDLFKTAQLRAQELDPELDVTKHFPEISHEDAIKMSLSGVSEVVSYMADLDVKLLINRTKIPFITSDFPVVKYNQYLELKKWDHGKTGYGNTGLQIIIPLNDELSILLYDGLIYNVGDKKKNYLGINKEKDVKKLNMLQLLNCLETVYFNEKISEPQMKELSEMASKFKRANEMQSTLHYISDGKIPFQPKKENLIVSGSTELEVDLKIAGISVHAFGKAQKLSNTMAQLRPVPLQLMRERDRNKANY